MTEVTHGQSVVRRILIAALAFQGASGIIGGIALVADPSGGALDVPFAWLEDPPFGSYLFPGLVLLVVLGMGPLFVAYELRAARPGASTASLLIGLALLVWLGAEILIIGYHDKPPLQLVYGILGVFIIVLALLSSMQNPASAASHLTWIPLGAVLGFTASFVFGDMVMLPIDLYYSIYFGSVFVFLGIYIRKTNLDLRTWVSRRLVAGVVFGILGGIVLMEGVLARPETARLSAVTLAWAIVWRGVIYGSVDGLLLLAFPWIVVWRAFGAEERGWIVRMGSSVVALVAIFLITTTYHLGYGDFRSRRLLQPNIGGAIGSIPTLVTANPVASPISHVLLHVTAVIHSPETDLFLPPHREKRAGTASSLGSPQSSTSGYFPTGETGRSRQTGQCGPGRIGSLVNRQPSTRSPSLILPPQPATGSTMTEPAESQIALEPIDDYRWLIPKSGAMRVEGIVYADRRLLDEILTTEGQGVEALRQVANVACLPGIVGRSIGMPDIHWGYGFAIGGVAAFDPDQGGVVSPGGVGYDINCGVRLLRSSLSGAEVRPRIAALMNQIMRDVPAGVGAHYERFRLSREEVRAVLSEGARWAVRNGYGTEADLRHTEAEGALPGADPDRVSPRAIERGIPQLGTVGSGNHFIEVNAVDEIYDAATARKLGLDTGTVCVLIHSGSRGLGYQVCDDHLSIMQDVVQRHGIEIPDRQLACAPLSSPEASRYLGAMNAAGNYAFANRQMMAYRVREAFARVFARSWQELGLELVYDVAHNMAKWETHAVDDRPRRLCVHRKGATRAFPPGHPEIPSAYRELGQPVLIPGDMARYSYVLVGTDVAYRETFGSTCHGAGRRMSRTRAKRSAKGRSLRREFAERGIEVRASSYATIAEEIPEAYKDVAEVVEVVHRAGIARKVVRLRPMGVLKG